MSIVIIVMFTIFVIGTVKMCKEDDMSLLATIIITSVSAIIIFLMYSFAYRKMVDFFTQTGFLEIIETLILSLVVIVIAIESFKIILIIAMRAEFFQTLFVALAIALIISNILTKTDDGTGIVSHIYDTVMIKIAMFISYIVEEVIAVFVSYIIEEIKEGII